MLESNPERLAVVDRALRLHGRPSLGDHAVERIGAEHGVAGLVLRLVHDGASLVAKLTPGAGGRCEAGFYRDVGARLAPSVPACLGVLGEGANSVVLLEDLGTHPADVRAEDAIDFLARLHGGGFEASAPWAHAWLDVARVWSGRLDTQAPRFASANRSRWTAATAARLEAIAHQCGATLARLSTIDPVLVHHDFHAGNWMTRGGGIVVVDWQATSIGPAALDVVRCLTEACPDPGGWPSLLERYRARLPVSGLEDALCASIAEITSVPFFAVPTSEATDRMREDTLGRFGSWIEALDAGVLADPRGDRDGDA